MSEVITRNNHDFVQGYEDYKLPRLDDYTEQKVMYAVKELYKGYEPPVAESMKSLDQVVAYVLEREKVHGETMGKVVSGATKTRGVISACRWDLGHIIEVAMSNADFGADVVPKLAAALNVTEPEIHAFRQIHSSMTRVEAYVLGLYGTSLLVTMKIASIPDEATRKKIINECCNSGISIMDHRAVSRVRSRMENAIRVALLPTTAGVIGEDMEDTEGAQEIEATPIITADEEALAKLIKLTEKISKDVKPWKQARVESDSDLLAGFDPNGLDMGKETVSIMSSQLFEGLRQAAIDLNEAEDFIRQLREAVDATLLVFGNETTEDSEANYSE